jgi:ubiquinone/menaquinone biosynthesis C-methylase UbiE
MKHATTTTARGAPATKGHVLHGLVPWYDLMAWLMAGGRERALRERMLDRARVARAERVLDVGCGTGTLVIAAKHRVGAAGVVRGIDASPEMIARARRKAAKAGVDATFEVAVVEALPFADASFDVVMSTLMLHHLPRPVRRQCAAEMRRVLRPGGRALAVDFGMPGTRHPGIIGRLHRRGHVPLSEVVELLEGAALRVVESGAMGTSSLYFVLAEAPTHG